MGIDDSLEPDRARELVASSEVVVFDIRSDEEWREKRVAGARHVDEAELDSAIGELDEDEAVLIVCGDGERSAGLAAELRDSGREATCIEGGMDAWESEKLPMQPSTDPDDDARI
jgi:rhodanese-related sulfurtransferase